MPWLEHPSRWMFQLLGGGPSLTQRTDTTNHDRMTRRRVIAAAALPRTLTNTEKNYANCPRVRQTLTLLETKRCKQIKTTKNGL